MRFKQILTAFGKALCYALLFIGVQFFVSFAALLFLSIRAGMQAAMDAATPNLGMYMEQATTVLLEHASLLTLISNALTLVLLLPVFAAQKKHYAREVGLFPLVPGAAFPLVAGAVALACSIMLPLALLPIPEELMEAYGEAAAGLADPALVSALSTVLFAPIAEEVIFRGLVYTRLRRAIPAWLACLITSLAFGLLHGQIIWVSYAFVMGVALTMVFERTKTLWASIIVHITFNLFGSYGAPYLPGNLLVLIVGVAGVVLCWRQLTRIYPRV